MELPFLIKILADHLTILSFTQKILLSDAKLSFLWQTKTLNFNRENIQAVAKYLFNNATYKPLKNTKARPLVLNQLTLLESTDIQYKLIRYFKLLN